MSEENVCRVSCERMEPDEAVLLYSGVICDAGASLLEQQFESLFGYYQYQRIQLRLESPGGSIDAMHYILRQINKYEQLGKVVAVGTTFMCASAAAVLLAMGEWGQRRVDQGTGLLFHTVRVDSRMQGMTAAVSGSLSRKLLTADQRAIDMLVGRMVRETGSASALLELVRVRWQQVESDWHRLQPHLDYSSAEIVSKVRPDWMRALGKLARSELASGKFTAALKKHLYMRMQRDCRMDLREAYILCLIDEVVGVLSEAPTPKEALPKSGSRGHANDSNVSMRAKSHESIRFSQSAHTGAQTELRFVR